MIERERILQRLEAANMSQAELARRVGVKQQTIGQLVTGRAGGSRFLHQIARELQTTPAYLTGETDDPDSDVPDCVISYEERGWLELLNGLDSQHRDAVIQLAKSLASAGGNTVHAPRRGFRGAQPDG